MAEPENEFSLRNAILGPERTSVPEPVVGMAELVGGPEQWGQDFKAGMNREFPL